MKKFVALIGGLVTLITLLAGCSAPQTLDEAEAAFVNAHDQCVEGLLKAEVVESEIRVEEERDYATLIYRVKDGQSKALVECVSLKLIGQDLTERVFTRAELLYFEQKTGNDSSEIYWDFSSVWVEKWDKPFNFFKSQSIFDTYYSFTWVAPSTE